MIVGGNPISGIAYGVRLVVFCLCNLLNYINEISSWYSPYHRCQL